MRTNLNKPTSIIFLNALTLFVSQVLNAQTLSLQLTASNFNGFNVSCFGNQDGTIDLTVSGGTAPYTYQWSNDAQTEDLSELPSGYYHVTVTDVNQHSAEAEITLIEPKAIKIELDVYKYPNSFNISQNGSCNGNVAATVSGGVTPYTYHWKPGNQTISNPTNLCAGIVFAEVTDNNSCFLKENTVLSQPEKDTWLSSGNTGSNPETQFLGTTDNTDFVLRTSNTERIILKGNGDVQIKSMTGGIGMLYVDEDGTLRTGYHDQVQAPCNGIITPIWQSFLNPLTLFTCPLIQVGVGAYIIPAGIRFMVSGSTYLNGNAGIGTYTIPANFRLAVNGKIICTEVKVQAYLNWDCVFANDYNLISQEELAKYLIEYHHLPNFPSYEEIKKEDGISVGDFQMRILRTIEEQALYILDQEKRLSDQEKIIALLEKENSSHK